MRDVDSIKSVSSDAKEEVLEINHIPDFDVEDYDLFNDKDFKQYIFRIEKNVRGSFEYRTFINFLRNYMEMNKCSFFKNVTNAENYKIKIEIHHEPITLYDIVMIVYSKRCANGELLDEELVSKEIMINHYYLLVGLIPLSETVHQLVHNNYLFIPLSHVLGKWQEFISIYGDYIDAEIRDKLDRAIEYTKCYNDGTVEDTHILDKKFVYLNTSGAYESPDYKEIFNGLNQKIREIQQRSEIENQRMINNNQYDNNINQQSVPMFNYVR